MSIVVDSPPRPARLNFAGFCWYCGERGCDDPRCVHMHEESHWGLCLDCQGSQNIGSETESICRVCNGGLVEYGAAETDWAAGRDGFGR